MIKQEEPQLVLEDIHTRTAKEIFKVSEDQVTPEMRRQAKAVGFGVRFGMSETDLSKQLGITLSAGQLKKLDSALRRL